VQIGNFNFFRILNFFRQIFSRRIEIESIIEGNKEIKVPKPLALLWKASFECTASPQIESIVRHSAIDSRPLHASPLLSHQTELNSLFPIWQIFGISILTDFEHKKVLTNQLINVRKV
jgi:hypothetical protein